MKIRIDASSFKSRRNYSGVGYYSKLLADAFEKKYKIHLVTGPVSNEFVNKIYRKFVSYGVVPYFDIFMEPVDLTLFPNFEVWPTMKSRRSAVVIHDLTYLYYPELVEDKNLAHLRRVVPKSILKADFIITVSESVKQELLQEFSLNPDRCIVTPIPPDSIYFEKNHNEIHKKYNIPTKKFILFVGNMEPRKNLSLLIRAYQQLSKDIKNEYSLVIGGGKGWKAEINEKLLAAAREAGEKIIHVGYIDQEDISAFYQSADLFVMPSLYEGFGMPILEAMASGTPVVASDIPVLHETAGAAALFFNPKSESDLREKMSLVLTDKKIAEDLLLKSTRHLTKFSWDKNVSDILSVAFSDQR